MSNYGYIHGPYPIFTVVNRFKTTSQICCNCGRRLNLILADRMIRYECGIEIDRDLNASVNILKLGIEETTSIKNLPLDWGKVTPVEKKASAQILGHSPHICVSYASVKQEAQVL